MRLFEGFESEYQKRHKAIWPELQNLLRSNGISEYSIFLDDATGTLISVLEVENPENLDNLAQHPIMRKWWDYMKDIMESNPDSSPVSIPLKELFYLR